MTRPVRFACAVLLLLSGCAKPSKTADTAAVPVPQNLPGAAVIVGTYAKTDDGATFTHCPTQARYPIAREGAFDALQRAVADAPHDVSKPLVVSLVGRLQPLPVVAGNPPRDQLIVDRVLRVWPDETCDKIGVDTPLDNTYWKLVELNGKAVATHEDQREVHMVLRIDGHAVDGFAGCADFAGEYHRDGSTLRFDRFRVPPTVCQYIDDQRAFLLALSRATHYQILGESLDLRDDTGSIARLRAVYFR